MPDSRSYDPTQLVPQEEEENVLLDPEGNALPNFDPKYEDDFLGLLYIGALQDEFTWLGHKIVIRTLKDGESLFLGQIIRPYQDTLGIEIANAMATVALCVVSIDGKDLPVPIGETNKINQWAVQRFEYVRDNWFSYTVDEIYNRYLVLKNRARLVVEALGKASAQVESTPTSNEI